MGTQTTIPYFGRKWELVISNSPSSTDDGVVISLNSGTGNAWTPEPLRITFDTMQTASQAFWYADITVFNLNSDTANTVLTQGMNVKLSAGYMNQPYGLIWEGVIFQPMWSRENVTDFKLNLHCIVGIDSSLQNNFVSTAFSSGVSQRQLIAQMASDALTPINILPQDEMTISDLSKNKLSRGGIMHGEPAKFFKQLSILQGVNYWYEQAGAQLRQLLHAPDTAPVTTFGAGNGLIGTPQQTQYGVNCRVLLNPNISVGTKIQLDQSVAIQQIPKTAGAYPSLLDQSGTYAVGAVRHVGDSRGNTWYSEVTGMLYADQLLQVLQGW